MANTIAKETSVQIVHETHRGKFSFAAHITKPFSEILPQLQLTLDASHWCNVAETFLQDQQEAMALAIIRTHHIHARVGYTEGPQVPDPSDSLWQEAVQHHTVWWQTVAEQKKKRGENVMTITTEFGAPPYTVLLPGTHQPIASQWQANLFMKDYLRQHLKT